MHMSLFTHNPDFYPTPKAVIRKMVESFVHTHPDGHRSMYQMGSLQILEPSAGKGDILDFLKEECRVNPTSLYAIEQDPDLIHILQSKGHKVIANDFLEYTGDHHFDLIIGNPPYSSADTHILRMWEVLHSGQIISLCNAETILNPYSEKRKLLQKLIADHGSVEFIGQVFTDAERRTGVDSCIVTLSKQAKPRFDFTFENVTKETEFDFSEQIAGNEMAIADVTGNLIRSYQKTKDAFVNYIKAKKELEFYSGPILPSRETFRITGLADQAHKDGKTDAQRFNLFVDGIKLEAWKTILGKLNIQKYLTNSVLKNFNEFAKNQGALDLTKENIHSLVMMIVQNRDTIMTRAVLDVFDIFTKYHKENREHVEGWVTNESWIVGEKVILPHYIEMSYSGCYGTNHRYWDEFRDIEKVLCYLSGIPYEEIGQEINKSDTWSEKKNKDKQYVRTGMREAICKVPIGDQSWHDSEFFEIRCYKKGTLHLKWKDEALRARFNQIACEGKFNLGYSYKKRKSA
jgi:hypothetical protein